MLARRSPVQVIAILLGIVVFHTPVTAVGVLGIAVTCAGIAWYSLAGFSAKSSSGGGAKTAGNGGAAGTAEGDSKA